MQMHKNYSYEMDIFENSIINHYLVDPDSALKCIYIYARLMARESNSQHSKGDAMQSGISSSSSFDKFLHVRI